VLDSYFKTGDDGIVFASGNTNANRISSPGLPLTNVLVRNCSISSKSSAIKWEAIDFGGCDHADLADMLIEDVTIWGSSRGIGFQLRNGRGNFQNITVRRASIQTVYPTGVNWWGSGEPIWLTNIPTAKKEGNPHNLGTIKDVTFEDVAIESENALLISGIGRPLERLVFKNVSVTISVLGNATCRKGYPGSPAGCVDYRPLNCQAAGSGVYCPGLAHTGGVLLPEPTAAIRLEGAGSVKYTDVRAAYKWAGGASQRPSWWAESCVVTTVLNQSLDPWPYPQKFVLTGGPVKCSGGGGGGGSGQVLPSKPPLPLAAGPAAITSVPRVRSFALGDGAPIVIPAAGATITTSDKSLQAHAKVLARDLLHLAGITVKQSRVEPQAPAAAAGSFTIALHLNASMTDSVNAFFRYSLSVGASGAVISGGSVVAVAHGTATLLQQLRPAGGGGATVSPIANLTDWSTVEWTGFMYDLARDPVDVLTMQSLIDLCRFYKMRFMHIFATAEQGWRLPIPASATVDMPPVFEGAVGDPYHPVPWGNWTGAPTDRSGLGLALSQVANGSWTIRSLRPSVSLAGAAVVANLHNLNGPQCGALPTKLTDRLNVSAKISASGASIVVTTTKNGVPTNLCWSVFVAPAKLPPTSVGLSDIAARGAKACPDQWCNNSAVWAGLGTYAEARGVTLIPGIEIVGHNSLPKDIFGDPSSSLSCTNLASDTAISGVLALVDATIATFPTAPYVHIGWDETSTDGVPKTTSAPAFCAKHGLDPCSEDEIVNYFLVTVNEHVRHSTGVPHKRLMAYENVNTKGTKNHTVVTQPWWINGGNGYMEDQQKSNLHGNTLKYAELNLSTMQTAWKPRVYSHVKGVFDHSVAGTVYPHPAAAGAKPQCSVSKGVKFNNTHYADTDGPHTAKDPSECCSICSQTANCKAWSFQIDPQFANESTCRWTHLTYCCWLHADATAPITTDPTFVASGEVPQGKTENEQGFPIPVDKNLLGGEMVLWETQRGEQDKVGLLRYKAPPLAENTYAYRAPPASYYSEWAKTFAYLDGQFSAVIGGWRLVETGVTTGLAEILATDTETSNDHIQFFGDTLTVAATINRPGTTVRYTNSTFTVGSDGKVAEGGKYPTNSLGAVLPPSSSAPLVFTAGSAELGQHGYVVLRMQAFDDKTSRRVGEPVVKAYWQQPFKLVVAGTLRKDTLSFGVHPKLQYNTEGYATIALTHVSAKGCAGGTVHYQVGNTSNLTTASPTLGVGQQLAISGSVQALQIACVGASGSTSGGVIIGRVWQAQFTSNLGNGTVVYAPPDSVAAPAAIPTTQRWVLPAWDKPGNTTVRLDALLRQAGVPAFAANTSVKLNVTVMGGGSGGVLAMSTVYYDILTCYPMTIEVGGGSGGGQQSSVSFNDGADGYRSPGAGPGQVRTRQDPLYPTVAAGGGGGVTSSGSGGGVVVGGSVLVVVELLTSE
jgi:hypothetical protein